MVVIPPLPGELHKEVRPSLLVFPAKVYGVLMHDEDTPLSNMVKARWMELHNLLRSQTDEVRFVFFETPAKWTKTYKAFLLERFGGDKARLEKTLKAWVKPRDPGEVYLYLREFGLKATDLPCLVLFTSVMDKQAAVRRIPDYNEQDLFELFKEIVDRIYDCIDVQPTDDNARLQCIKQSLTSHRATASASTRHYAQATWEYFKKNPSFVIETAAGVFQKVSGLPSIA
jgi:hypothetical protein